MTSPGAFPDALRKRTAQINPDRFGVGIATISLVAIVMLSSMVFSYVAIAEAAVWTHAPYGMHWLAPIFIDGAIITYTVALAVFEARREPRKTLVRTRLVLWGFALLSVAINFAHAASGWEWSFQIVEAWFGYLIAVSAPIAALLSAEAMVRLTFRRRDAREGDESAPSATAAGVAEGAANGLTNADMEQLSAMLDGARQHDRAESTERPFERPAGAPAGTGTVEQGADVDAGESEDDLAITGPLYEEPDISALRTLRASYENPSYLPSVVEDMAEPDYGEYVRDADGVRDRVERDADVF